MFSVNKTCKNKSTNKFNKLNEAVDQPCVFQYSFFNFFPFFYSCLLESAESKRCAHLCWVQVAVHQQFYNVVGVFLITNKRTTLVKKTFGYCWNWLRPAFLIASTYSTKRRKTNRASMQLKLCSDGEGLKVQSDTRYSTSGFSRISCLLAPEYPDWPITILQLCVYRRRQRHQR